MSYVVPTNELTLSDIRTFKQSAIQAGIDRALALGLARTKDELVVRTGLPNTDFGAGAVGWTLENYSGPAIVATGWGSVFNAGALPANAPTLANSKIAVFYKFADFSAAPRSPVYGSVLAVPVPRPRHCTTCSSRPMRNLNRMSTSVSLRFTTRKTSFTSKLTTLPWWAWAPKALRSVAMW